MTMICETAFVTSVSAADELNVPESETIKMVEEISEKLDRSDPFYYEPYDTYSSSYKALSHHYLAAIVPSGTNFSNSFFNVFFYLYNDVVPSNATSNSKYIISDSFSPYVQLFTTNINNYSATTKSLNPVFLKSIGNPQFPDVLFSYYLEGIENNSNVTSEYNVHRRTSPNYYSPSCALPTDIGSNFVKVVYALGDCDRNGKVNQADAEAVQKYLLSISYPVPGRTPTQAAYDTIAFKLAADFNQDGTIGMVDAIAIAQFAATHPV